MTDVLVTVPVLARPERVDGLLWSIDRTTGPHGVRVEFVCSPGDDAEVAAVERAVAARDEPGAGVAVSLLAASWPPGLGDYARKVNASIARARPGEEWVFMGADDLCFCPGWLEHALVCHRWHGNRVVGTNDLGNSRVTSGQHATHALVHLDYVAELGVAGDEPGRLLHEGYWHNYCDDEMVWTARARGEFEACLSSWVEHLHPNWGKAPDDATYRKGLEHFEVDRETFNSRRHLWERTTVRPARAATR